MDELRQRIAVKKAELDRLRPLSGAAVAQLQKHDDVELTYTSSAIEGNTLSLRETAEVIEHGITVGGKRLSGGYPPVAVRPEDRKIYLHALERGSLAEDLRPFQTFTHERLDATLEGFLSALQEMLPAPAIGSTTESQT